MRAVTFTESDLQAIKHDRYHHPDPHVQRKMEVLWLKSHDLPHEQISALAGVSLRTVGRYLDDYLAGGLAQLRGAVRGGQPDLPDVRDPGLPQRLLHARALDRFGLVLAQPP